MVTINGNIPILYSYIPKTMLKKFLTRKGIMDRKGIKITAVITEVMASAPI